MYFYLVWYLLNKYKLVFFTQINNTLDEKSTFSNTKFWGITLIPTKSSSSCSINVQLLHNNIIGFSHCCIL